MLWPWFLAFGLITLGAGWLASDRRGQWVAGIWCLGILLMQAEIPEPGRWIYAVALWTVLTTIVGLRSDTVMAALCMWLVPIGYGWLAADAFGLVPLGTGGQNFAFGITEAAGVAAVLAGGRGIPRGIGRWIRDQRASRVASMGGGRSVAIAPPPQPKE